MANAADAYELLHVDKVSLRYNNVCRNRNNERPSGRLTLAAIALLLYRKGSVMQPGRSCKAAAYQIIREMRSALTRNQAP